MSRLQHRFTRMLVSGCLLGMSMVAAADSWKSADQMATAARALLASLDPEQREAMQFALHAEERGRWSNLPVLMVPPPGIMLKTMTDSQRRAVQELLRASMSSQGYAKFTGVIRLDALLHEQAEQRWNQASEDERTPRARAGVDAYDPGHYAVALFGTPGSEEWGWKIAGHHAVANFTVAGDRVAFTPSFLGSSPMVVETGPYAGTMVLPQEGARGIDLMQALEPAQQAKAVLSSEPVRGIFEGPGRRASLAEYEGLKATELNAVQKRLLNVLVEEYVRNADFDAADAQLATIKAAGMDELWFSWRGPVDPAGRFYYRVHGPRLLIEYNRQDENHDHSIVRDPGNDYGDDWFGRHLEEHHPSREAIREDLQRRFGQD